VRFCTDTPSHARLLLWQNKRRLNIMLFLKRIHATISAFVMQKKRQKFFCLTGVKRVRMKSSLARNYFNWFYTKYLARPHMNKNSIVKKTHFKYYEIFREKLIYNGFVTQIIALWFQINSKYSEELAQECLEWVKQITGEDFSTSGEMDNFYEIFKNGTLLCR
jgi:hypothetical protein